MPRPKSAGVGEVVDSVSRRELVAGSITVDDA